MPLAEKSYRAEKKSRIAAAVAFGAPPALPESADALAEPADEETALARELEAWDAAFLSRALDGVEPPPR